MNRRHFLASVSATAIMPMRTFAAQDALRLKAEMVTQQILPDGDGATSMLGFNGSMPGPELRVQRGERVNIEVERWISTKYCFPGGDITFNPKLDALVLHTQ